MSIQKDIIETEVRFTSNEAMANLTKLESSTSDLRRENERLAVTKAKLKSLGKEETEDYKKITAAMAANNKKLKENESSMAALRRVVGLTGMSMKDLRKRANELAGQLNSTVKAANPKEYARLEKELVQVRRQMTNLQAGTSRTGSLMRTFGSLLPITSIAAATAAVGSLVKELFTVSKRVQAEDRKALIVLGDSMGYVESQADKLAKKIGVTRHEFTAMVTNTADLLVPLDFTRQKAAEMSVEIQSLAGAMDEWTAGQFGVVDASNTLNKAVLGEMEELKKYGIAIRQDSEEFRNLVKEKKAAGAASDEQARALASLELIMKKSRDAQASFAGEGNQLIRWQKSVTLGWRQLKENVVGYFDTKPSEKIEKEKDMVNALVAELMDSNIQEERRALIIGRLKDLAPDIIKTLDDEGKATIATADALREYNQQMVNKIILSSKEEELQKQLKKEAKAQEATDAARRRLIQQINTAIAGELEAGKRDSYQAIMVNNSLDILEKVKLLQEQGLKLTAERTRYTGMFAEGYSVDITSTYEYLKSAEDKRKDLADQIKADIEAFKKEKGLEDLLNSGGGGGVTGGNTKDSKKLLAALEEAYQARMVKIEAQYAAEKMSKVRHDAEMLAEELAYIQAQIVLKQQLKESTVDLELKYQEKLSSITEQVRQEYEALVRDNEKAYQDLQKEGQDYIDKMLDADAALADQKIEAQIRVAEAIQKIREDDLTSEQEASQKKAAIYQDLINTLSGAVYDFASDQENGMQNFIKSVANMALDLLKTQVEIAVAGVTVQSLASAESVASWGAAGLAKAAVLVGLIEAAFAGVKGLVNSGISNMGKKNLWEGGYTPRGRWDEPQGVVHSDEFVANRHAVRNPHVRTILDVIDLAQRTGQIGSLNTDTILRAVEARRGGFAGGGYVPSSPQSAKSIDTRMSPEEKAILLQLSSTVKGLQDRLDRGIPAFITYQEMMKKIMEVNGIKDKVTLR